MQRLPLTRRQREILDFVVAYRDEHDISPTLEEIARHFGVHKVTIFEHVSELERKGALRRGAPGVSRSLEIVPEAPRAGTGLQVLGTIAAGAPIEAIEDPEDLELGDLVPPGREVYALRVRGDSMIEDAICDGDLVLVEARNHARNGETVVAVLPDGEATLKRLYREKGHIRLQPANASLNPIYATDVEIRGIVIGVVRRL